MTLWVWFLTEYRYCILAFFFFLVSVVILKINSLAYPLKNESSLKHEIISHILLIHIANYRCIISWRLVTHKPQQSSEGSQRLCQITTEIKLQLNCYSFKYLKYYHLALKTGYCWQFIENKYKFCFWSKTAIIVVSNICQNDL